MLGLVVVYWLIAVNEKVHNHEQGGFRGSVLFYWLLCRLELNASCDSEPVEGNEKWSDMSCFWLIEDH